MQDSVHQKVACCNHRAELESRGYVGSPRTMSQTRCNAPPSPLRNAITSNNPAASIQATTGSHG